MHLPSMPSLPTTMWDNDSNALQPSGVGTAIVSPKIALLAATESSTDGDGSNGNQTIDLGLWNGFQVGNLVWNDVNNSSFRDVGESGNRWSFPCSW